MKLQLNSGDMFEFLPIYYTLHRLWFAYLSWLELWLIFAFCDSFNFCDSCPLLRNSLKLVVCLIPVLGPLVVACYICTQLTIVLKLYYCLCFSDVHALTPWCCRTLMIILSSDWISCNLLYLFWMHPSTDLPLSRSSAILPVYSQDTFIVFPWTFRYRFRQLQSHCLSLSPNV